MPAQRRFIVSVLALLAGLTAAGIFFVGIGLGQSTDRIDTVGAIVVFGAVYIPATVGARRLFGP
jgi:hypothetical protein